MGIGTQRFLRIVTPGLLMLVLVLLSFGDPAAGLERLRGSTISLGDVSLPLVAAHHQFDAKSACPTKWRRASLPRSGYFDTK
jgi:hypothetical protein